ncbi:helix-turn-helix domain-containing protein [Streptomyces sp. NPDC088196]|uniref:helix-turn-helix domain-containing protein n=1 Tax=Streptomyces sp. NPDC088196 TaxID=3154868 RepID=UPI00344BC899
MTTGRDPPRRQRHRWTRRGGCSPSTLSATSATSVPDIRARAELTKGAIYWNLSDRDALFLALYDRQWHTRADRLRPAVPCPALPTGRELSRILDGDADLPRAAMEPDRR